MKVHLMHTDHDFDLEAEAATGHEEAERDLGIPLLLEAMAAGDVLIRKVCRAALAQPLTDVKEIRQRQRVAADVLANEDAVRAMYALTAEGIAADQHIHIGMHSSRPGLMLNRARANLTAYTDVLRRLRQLAERTTPSLSAPWLLRMADTLTSELSEDYLQEVEETLCSLRFTHGSLESARLGSLNAGRDYVLRAPPSVPWWRNLLGSAGPRGRHVITIPDRDMAGFEALTALKDRSQSVASDALVQASDHVLSFFHSLRRELAFYLGCANLASRMNAIGQPTCFPDVSPLGDRALSCNGVIDPVLALSTQRAPVGNDLRADGVDLVVLTGANQGGKSTLLRALGLAQLMAQAGCLVTATRLSVSVASGVRAHFKREEDRALVSGKFDEELSRMSDLVDHLRPGALLLCNESFSTTNEREAAVIGGDIVCGLVDAGARVLLVTHLYELGTRLRDEIAAARFLRAAREDDGTRTFRLEPGDPQHTSYADDLYAEVFG